ncbi:MAG: NAD-binding protein, partial [Pseudomonadota bacterium]
RFGQIIGRVLRSKGIPFTALEADPEQVEVVRRFGNKVYFGDARRLDLLEAAGAENAKYLIMAIDDVERSVEAAELIRQRFPHLKILARARNRVHAYRLMDLGISRPIRDTLHSSLHMATHLLELLGHSPQESKRATETFLEYDERFMREQSAFYQDESQLIQTAKQAADQLASVLRTDRDHDNESPSDAANDDAGEASDEGAQAG